MFLEILQTRAILCMRHILLISFSSTLKQIFWKPPSEEPQILKTLLSPIRIKDHKLWVGVGLLPWCPHQGKPCSTHSKISPLPTSFEISSPPTQALPTGGLPTPLSQFEEPWVRQAREQKWAYQSNMSFFHVSAEILQITCKQISKMVWYLLRGSYVHVFDSLSLNEWWNVMGFEGYFVAIYIYIYIYMYIYYVSFNIGIATLVTKILNLGSDLWRSRRTWTNADLPFFTLIFPIAHLRFFILTSAKAYFEAKKQFLTFVNDEENLVGPRNFIHQLIANV